MKTWSHRYSYLAWGANSRRELQKIVRSHGCPYLPELVHDHKGDVVGEKMSITREQIMAECLREKDVCQRCAGTGKISVSVGGGCMGYDDNL